MRVIMGNRYQGYEEALKFMKIDSLKERRALKFARKSIKQDILSSHFPLNDNVHSMKTRNPEKYSVKI